MNFKHGDKVVIISDYFTDLGETTLPKGSITSVYTTGDDNTPKIGEAGWYIGDSFLATKHVKLFNNTKTVLPLP